MAEQVRVRVQFPPHNTEQLGLGAAKRGFELSKAAHLASKIKTGFACVFFNYSWGKTQSRSEQPQALETAQCILEGREKALFSSNPLGLSSPGAAECPEGRSRGELCGQCCCGAAGIESAPPRLGAGSPAPPAS